MRSRRQSEEGDNDGRRSSSPSRLSLQVLDVTSTAVALSVYSSTALAAAQDGGSGDGGHDDDDDDKVPNLARHDGKTSTMSIQVNGRPWPHVAHAGSESSDSLVNTADWDIPTSAKGNETTIIIYGLDPGKDYELTLDVIAALDDGGEPELHQATVDVETAIASRRPSEDSSVANVDNGDYTPTSAAAAPDGPPPPYSASVHPVLTDEPQLRALLKRLRASSKRTESVLNASISALKKNVEKGLKEDQRARTRIVGLEEAIRRTSDGTRDMRTVEMEACEERIRELCELEEEVREELERRKDSSKGPSAHVVRAALERERRRDPSPVRQADEAGGDDEESHEGIGELSRELDTLNRSIDEAEKQTSRNVKETLRALEHELAHIEDEIGYIDRAEVSHYATAVSRKSYESLSDRPFVVPPPHQPAATGFNLRWRRAPPASQLPKDAPSMPTSSAADPRSFGRFFRRSAASAAEDPAAGSAAQLDSDTDQYMTGEAVTDIQRFAQAHQARSMPPPASSTSPSTSPSPSPSTSTSTSTTNTFKVESSPKSSRIALFRRRSGSGNSTEASEPDRVPSAVSPKSSLSTVPAFQGSTSSDKTRPSTSSGGSSWGRWSQVVGGKGKSVDAGADKR
ncbi:hypothetical protein ACM66B_004328 [Microbotryomycetes sp. NB124-2]